MKATLLTLALLTPFGASLRETVAEAECDYLARAIRDPGNPGFIKDLAAHYMVQFHCR